MQSSIPRPSVADSTDCPDAPVAGVKARTESISQKSDNSQTAADFIRDQLRLEADAREALPFSIDHCTNPLGPLRQSVFACMTCNPPPPNPSDSYDAAGVCYACSVQCHGEHTLVEIFAKRNFTCDCGTTRFPKSSACTLRIHPQTSLKGGVHSEEPNPNNKYNHNFRNRFCGCQCDYDPFEQKGTMFQCLGLGTHETGGCGEDWWHPGCVVGLGPKWFENLAENKVKPEVKDVNGPLPTINEDAEATGQTGNETNEQAEEDDNDPPPPPGFPAEDEFDGFICYKCVETHPWIKRYAGTPGFLEPVFLKQGSAGLESASATPPVVAAPVVTSTGELDSASKKRKADDETDSQTSKRPRSEVDTSEPSLLPTCKLAGLPPPPATTTPFSLFLTPSFRTNLCHCPSCFPLLAPHPQLLEEEETYEPPAEEDTEDNRSSNGSLLERGENALRNVDRVRAIEGVMAYQHLKDRLMPFFQKFAESKQAVSAEDITAYFAKLRGDDEAIREAGERAGREGPSASGSGDGEDPRREENGY
ncbi:putative zinc finger in N-recognin-domain-containing protein [Chaetomium fimeti]|uniref:Zinc finger in N-recognin-domain-containing protein n=1 Tax=Chaetomium fimeti TaxID=1854472 RepID=A0AAE0HHR5_9PEZI|nr:putative zinc finger in N-recognin-domain-containing protein [Chaetomium fimeti]